ncbi:MAG: DUF3285 domain-containing protein [Spirulinaceae cyanobacterium]
MNQPSDQEQTTLEPSELETSTPKEPPPSYTKLAMRNMVRKGGKSLRHFFLSAVGLIAFFIGLSYLTKP